MEINQAKETLEIRDSFTLQELKTFFRKLSLIHHPDVGGDAKKFNKLVEAFEELKEHVIERKKEDTKLVDGRHISKVGQGYPITESARTCETCDGKGYKAYNRQQVNIIKCPSCNGTRLRVYPCKYCEGTGSYKGKVTCKRCNGTGKFYPKAQPKAASRIWWPYTIKFIPTSYNMGLPCHLCHGSGTYMQNERTGQKYLYECTDCKGIGEVKMWNPVLPRGFLAQSNK